jgi:hypothetical protein
VILLIVGGHKEQSFKLRLSQSFARSVILVAAVRELEGRQSSLLTLLMREEVPIDCRKISVPAGSDTIALGMK